MATRMNSDINSASILRMRGASVLYWPVQRTIRRLGLGARALWPPEAGTPGSWMTGKHFRPGPPGTLKTARPFEELAGPSSHVRAGPHRDAKTKSSVWNDHRLAPVVASSAYTMSGPTCYFPRKKCPALTGQCPTDDRDRF